MPNPKTRRQADGVTERQLGVLLRVGVSLRIRRSTEVDCGRGDFAVVALVVVALAVVALVVVILGGLADWGSTTEAITAAAVLWLLAGRRWEPVCAETFWGNSVSQLQENSVQQLLACRTRFSRWNETSTKPAQ